MDRSLLEPDSRNANGAPRLTADVPAVAGLYKQRPEDFLVEELPLYPACGSGTHVHFRLEKRGLTTRDAVALVAEQLGVEVRAIGFAGQKDACSISVQTLSVEHVDPARVLALEAPRLRVLSAERHTNKLKLGHLAGNRFAIKLRGVDRARIPDVERIVAELTRRGVPNYFGEQRFGVRGDGARAGRALLQGDHLAVVRAIAGGPSELDTGAMRRARELFDAGDYAASAAAWPRSARDALRLTRAMARERGDPARALRSLDRWLLRFFVSAFQSRLFNRVVAARIAIQGRLLAGDLAWRHQGGAVFEVEDPEREQPRADALEISPSGPLFGPRMTRPTGEPARIEQAALDAEQIEREAFERRGPWRPAGGRRPLRIPLTEAQLAQGSDEHGPYAEVRFVLPAGAYATVVLDEILK
jgi:tRNA pseudouridine13 synthase